MDPLSFLVMFGGAGLMTFVAWRFLPKVSFDHALRSMPRTPAAKVRPGDTAKLVGRLRRRSGGSLVAPLSERKCAYYELRVEGTTPTSGVWKRLLFTRRGEAFALEVDGVEVLVPADTEALLVEAQEHLVEERGVVALTSAALSGLLRQKGIVQPARLRAYELRLEEGAELAVLARWRSEAAPVKSSAGYREAPTVLVASKPERASPGILVSTAREALR